MKTLSVLFVLSVLFLTGCGTPKVWYQAGKTPAEAHRDLARCRLEAQPLDNKLTTFAPLLYRLQNEGGKHDFIRNCMGAEGWILTPRNQVPNGIAYPEDD